MYIDITTEEEDIDKVISIIYIEEINISNTVS